MHLQSPYDQDVIRLFATLRQSQRQGYEITLSDHQTSILVDFLRLAEVPELELATYVDPPGLEAVVDRYEDGYGNGFENGSAK